MTVTDDNAIPLMSLAEYLQIEDLKSRLMDYLNKNITRTNVLIIIKKALDFKIGTVHTFHFLTSNLEVVIEKCLFILARNFSHIYAAGASLEFLPLNIMKDLLNHTSLTVSSEYAVRSKNRFH